MFKSSITASKMACPVRLLVAMMQIDPLHCPLNTEIIVADHHPDLTVFFLVVIVISYCYNEWQGSLTWLSRFA